MDDRFCGECNCSGKPEDFGGEKPHVTENWRCPLLGGTICSICCTFEVAGGMGAVDTLQSVMRKLGKERAAVHAVCVECPHGGPDLDRPPKLSSTKGNDGQTKRSGPEFDAAQKVINEEFYSRLDWVTNGKAKRLPPRDNGPLVFQVE